MEVFVEKNIIIKLDENEAAALRNVMNGAKPGAYMSLEHLAKQLDDALSRL